MGRGRSIEAENLRWLIMPFGHLDIARGVLRGVLEEGAASWSDVGSVYCRCLPLGLSMGGVSILIPFSI